MFKSFLLVLLLTGCADTITRLDSQPEAEDVCRPGGGLPFHNVVYCPHWCGK